MSMVQDIRPLMAPVVARVRPPGSKSLTNRALLIAALAEGSSRLTGVLDSVDVQVMVASLKRLGVQVEHDPAQAQIDLTGCGGRFPVSQASLHLENSGTSIRFLTAACAAMHGTYQLDGNARMRERPIEDLADSLRELGADVRCELGTGCPPVSTSSSGLAGGQATIATELSSQFLSALLMAAPLAKSPVELNLQGKLVSEPYIEMTLGVMARFGVHVETNQPGTYRITPHSYRGLDYDIEPDASAASYFFALAAITGSEVTVEGLSRSSLQGDVRFAQVLEQMGCQVIWGANEITVRGGALRGVDVDLNDISDTAQTLAVVAPFATGSTRIRNVAHMRHKETDRVLAVVTELRRLGVSVEEHPDGMTIHPGPVSGGVVATYDDHRMAMSFALLGLNVPGIQIANPECTSKTYPNFFVDLARVCDGRSR